jgi:hypothetical protein
MSKRGLGVTETTSSSLRSFKTRRPKVGRSKMPDAHKRREFAKRFRIDLDQIRRSS